MAELIPDEKSELIPEILESATMRVSLKNGVSKSRSPKFIVGNYNLL